MGRTRFQPHSFYGKTGREEADQPGSMPHLRHAIFLTLSILLLGSEVRAEGQGPKTAADVATPVTIVTVLMAAKEIVEGIANEEHRIPARRHIASVMERTGHAAAFGDYVAKSNHAWEDWQRQRLPGLSARDERRWQRLQNLEAQAKQTFLAGDESKAKELLLEAEGLRKDYQKMDVRDRASSEFLNWELERNDIAAALRRFQATDWTTPAWRVRQAELLANACAAAGRKTEGRDLLMQTKARPDVANAPLPLQILGEALWRIGAKEEAVGVVRELVGKLLGTVAQDAKAEFPLYLARLQLAMGDQGGAIETLRQVRTFAAPLDYDPPPPRPDNLPPNAIWFGGAKIKAASERWLKSRNELARLWTRAGIEREAFYLLNEPLIDQAAILGNILRGQAERGDFGAAYRTVELIRSSSLTKPSEPSRITVRADGTVERQMQTAPIRPLNDNERAKQVSEAILTIALNAARKADVDAFHWAYAAREELASSPLATSNLAAYRGTLISTLTRTGRTATALDVVFALPDPGSRAEGLVRIADAMAGILDRRDDPLRH